MDFKKSLIRFSIGLHMLCLAPSPLHAQIANLVVNGSFESPVLTAGVDYVVPVSQLSPWQSTEAAVLIWVPSLPSEAAADGRQHAEVVSLWQVVPVTSGQDYRLSFRHAPRPGVDSTLNVSLDGHTVATFTENGASATGFNWKAFGTNFTATSSTITVRLDGVGVAGNAHIDAVVLERLPVAASIAVSEASICWESVASRSYQVQYRSPLTTNVWTDLNGPTPGNSTTNCVKDAVPPGEPQRFYRVTSLP